MKRILLTIGLFLCCSAYAGEFTMLLGDSHFTPQSDGTWWQQPFPHDLKMNSPSLGLRYDTVQNDEGWSFGVGYMNLGRISSTALAVALDGKVSGDGGYNATTKACNGPCWPVSHWNGRGSVNGLFGIVSKHYGPWSIEGGLYLYYPRWSVSVPDWISCATCTPQNITAFHHQHWQLGPMFGVRYKPSDWSLNLSVWQTQTQGDSKFNPYSPALYHAGTYNAAVGYSY